MWCQEAELSVKGDFACFQNAINVWIERPNVCCKRLSCAIVQQIAGNNDVILDNEYEIDYRTVANSVAYLSFLICESNSNKIYLRKFIPKKSILYTTALEIIIQEETSIFFVPVNHHGPSFTTAWFKISFCIEKNNIVLYSSSISTSERNEYLKYCNKIAKTEKGDESKLDSCYPTKSWMINYLLPNICKWTNQESMKLINEQKSTFSLPPSLSLISKQNYADKYEELKLKYGKEMAKIWPEVTDPQKFVYEDVAIATYLILLWKHERESKNLSTKQTFVDLGCGNGLLTYILISEGHQGKGIDLRCRKIWCHYPENIVLEEAVIEPTNLELISGYDWLLGNHSDELTPWIPVMAARLSYDVCYWVLPCCFYDFYGKYKRKTSLNGQYEEYLSHVARIGEMCGFSVQTDVMRIPSTKRVCQVGMSKSYVRTEHNLWLGNIKTMLDEQKSIDGAELKFIAREKIEKVRNCTKIAKTLQDHIVETIASKLLEAKHFKDVLKNNESISWNKGGTILLRNIVSLFDEKTRKSLKAECGGLKTLLKNNKQVFQICKDTVQIREWYNIEAENLKTRKGHNVSALKTKPCWFHRNHPDKCPREDEACTFIH